MNEETRNLLILSLGSVVAGCGAYAMTNSVGTSLVATVVTSSILSVCMISYFIARVGDAPKNTVKKPLLPGTNNY